MPSVRTRNVLVEAVVLNLVWHGSGFRNQRVIGAVGIVGPGPDYRFAVFIAKVLNGLGPYEPFWADPGGSIVGDLVFQEKVELLVLGPVIQLPCIVGTIKFAEILECVTCLGGTHDPIIQLPPIVILAQYWPCCIESASYQAVAPNGKSRGASVFGQRGFGNDVNHPGQHVDAVEQGIGTTHHFHSLHVDGVGAASCHDTILGNEHADAKSQSLLVW